MLRFARQWMPSNRSRNLNRAERRRHRRPLGNESLESRHFLAADPIISEFAASNQAVLKDADGDFSDWIEIHNRGDATANLSGWRLTDSAQDPALWTFPSVTIPAGGYITVFASGKNRIDPERELHTNFRLGSGGEHLALVRPDGSIATQFDYPEQFADVSYGYRMSDTENKFVSVTSNAQILVPTNGQLGTNWTQPDFVPDASWLTQVGGTPVRASLGYETNGTSGFAGQFLTDLSSTLKNVNAGVYVRIPFQVTDVTSVKELLFRIKYDDGYVMYLNGNPIDVQNASFFATYNSTASGQRANSEVVKFVEDDLSEFRDRLRNGTNVLAFHAMNLTAGDEDFLLSAELYTTSKQISTDQAGYFTTPTPKAINPSEFSLGPRIEDARHTPSQPAAAEALLVTARVTPTLKPLSSVELVYRVMYQPEVTVTMTDNGTGGDSVAGDGIYAAQIPAGVATAGQMIRYYVKANDTQTQASRLPAVVDKVGTDRSPEYFGTVVVDPGLLTNVPVFQWFTERASQARSRTGARVSVFYAGEFYDNVYARQRGGATNGSSQKFNFDDDHPFFVNDEVGRVAEFNMNANGSDPSFLRQPLAFDTYRYAGHESEVSFLVQMRVNGGADRVGVFVEQVDEDFLERNGLDPEGALYKFVQRSTLDPVFADVTTGIEKKTRLDEGLDDLRVVVQGLTQSTPEARARSVFDNFDVAQLMNYLALRSITLDADDVRKNFYGYRDTNGTGQWSIFPWDKDWTFGIEGDGAPYLWHPFFGDSSHAKANANQWNRLYDAVFKDPVLSSMFLRRLRTLMDEFLQPPGTPASEGFFEQQVDARIAANTGLLSNAAANNARTSIKAYVAARRNSLYIDHSIDNKQETEQKDIISEFPKNVQYFVPTDKSLGTTWTSLTPPAAVNQWPVGEAGFGFGSAFTAQVKTQVNPSASCATCTSIYMRYPFQVADPSALKGLTLRAKFDDGFVAYLNGVEVARSNFSGTPGFDSRGTNHPNTEAVQFENFNISSFINRLQPGNNVLAIHVMNTSATGSDLLMSPALVDGLIGDPNVAGIPHAQTSTPPVTFGTIEHDPTSGNQDEEYIELRNPLPTAVDISGWKLTGGVEHEFRAGTVIPANSSLFVTPSVQAFLKRTTGPKGGEGRFVQGNYQGHLSNLGETVELWSSEGTKMASYTTPNTPSPLQQFLRISEIHYNPAGPLDQTEFIELTNISSGPSATVLNLNGLRLSGGPDQSWVAPSGTSLAPGQYLVIARDPVALRAAYPQLAANQVLGPFTGALANQGERLVLDDARGNTIVDLSYDDSQLWPDRADGAGASLEINVDLSATAAAMLDKHTSWRGSVEYGGSPGRAGAAALGVVVNEVRANNNGQNPGDAIELWNTTSAPVNLSGWYLSDTADNLLQYALPAGTQIPAGGYLVLTQSQLPFQLNGDDGDDVWLVKAANNQVTHFADDVHFGGMALGESFGRVPSPGPSRLQPLKANSLGAANGDFRVGPVVISELMYHPTAPSSAAVAADPNITADRLEYIEIHNPTGSEVDLSQWRLRGGIEFDFEAGTRLGAGKALLVVPFNPLAKGNGSRTRAFRAHYGLSEDVVIVGGYTGQLSDNEDRVQLQRIALPIVPPPATPIHLLEDEALYSDALPWPSSADGTGQSLVRSNLSGLGMFAASWQAATPTPGQVDSRSGDLNNDGIINIQDVNLLTAGVRSGQSQWDWDRNGVVDAGDAHAFVRSYFGSGPGDANLDGQFDSRDIVSVFQRGQYEDNVPGNSTWDSGDWNVDGEFTTSDLVAAFQSGGYVAAASPSVAARAAWASAIDRLFEDSPL